jgi:UDP-GlcNAc3NAcA epimerase
MKIASIVGARPQFIKLAPLARTIQGRRHSRIGRRIEHIIIHTGQHYDYGMNKIFFKELGIPVPDYNLEVGSGSHGWQTAEILKKTEKALRKEKPDWALVYGDTNSTLAGALAAVKLNLPLAHIEAGLRSHDRRMPEEINRILTDHCSQILFCPTEGAVRNLAREGFRNIVEQGRLPISLKTNRARSFGVPFPWVVNVGDLMNDALLLGLSIARKKSTILEKLRLRPGRYYLATIHRAENTDDPERLRALTKALLEIGLVLPVVFPVHPRTQKCLDRLSLLPAGSERLKSIHPVSYSDMLILEKNARIILTDSGGVQKEAYLLKVPCITLRDATEWPETVEFGWNRLAGSDPKNLRRKLKWALKQCEKFAASRRPAPSRIDYGKGHAAQRILSCLAEVRT